MAHKPEESLVGRTFEKCRLIGKLGTGGMGSVYLAEHFGLGRKVAVKILPSDMSRDPEYVARFMREATTAGRMEHPNIVQIHDVGYAEGHHFIVMQYVDGESLSTVVDSLGAMEPRDAAQVAAGILRGLHHAHEQGVVHRDVKPDNVLLAKGDEPKILDFGLAIETEASLHITRDGMVVGTPYYLAPEQARGQKATPSSDTYAAGVTLYYLLTGRRPFVGATALAVLNKHIHDSPVPPMVHNPKIPRPLNDIVLKMMAKRPEDRYPTAGAAAEDLERFVQGKVVRVTLPWRLPPLTRKVKLIAAASAGALFLGIVLAVALRPRTEAPAVNPGPAPGPIALPPSPGAHPELLQALSFENDHKNDFAAYEKILGQYDAIISAATSADLAAKAHAERNRFAKQMEGRAAEEYARLRVDPDPVARRAALENFPVPLLKITEAGRKVREELARMPERIDKKFADEQEKLSRALEKGDFGEARRLIGAMRGYAEGPRQEKLQALEADLPRIERDFKDPLVQEYARLHEKFERLLGKRENAQAYAAVTQFLREHKDRAERDRSRVQIVNYDRLLAIVPDSTFPYDILFDVCQTVTNALGSAEDRLAYHILTDLEDCLETEWLLRRAGMGIMTLDRSQKDVTLATLGASGHIRVGPPLGIELVTKVGLEKQIVIRELLAGDLVLLASEAEGQTVEASSASNALLVRAGAIAFLHSQAPNRLAESVRWLKKAAELDKGGPAYRLERVLALGFREARERLGQAQADAATQKVDAARKSLAELAAQWDHEPELKAEIGRATAAMIYAQLIRANEGKDSARVKLYSRELRERHAGQYDEETAGRIFAHALRSTGYWQPVLPDVKGDTWVWEGKAQGAPAPARAEGTEGLRLSPGNRIGPSPDRARGVTGASVQLRLNEKGKPPGAGLVFGASAKDGGYRRLVFKDAGQVALYEEIGQGETLVKSATLAKRLEAGKWTDLSYIAEGGDLVCYVDQCPIFIVRAALSPEGGILLVSDVDANFRQLQLRR